MLEILIADDDPAVRRLLERLLRAPQRKIIAVADGKAAVEQAKARKPDVMILDVDMPGLNGHKVCQVLRGDPATREIPILMLTGLSGIENEVEGLHQGADAYVSKPFESKHLLARLNALLRPRGKRMTP